MPRRSTRLRVVQQRDLAGTSDSSNEDDDFTETEEEEEVVPPPRKKRRPTTKSVTRKDTQERIISEKWKKVRGRRGLLSSLKEFPLDVLFEIFEQLQPEDLLNLSRTTKSFRENLYPGLKVRLYRLRLDVPPKSIDLRSSSRSCRSY
ncbi:unnamed protein product [Mycena citricolor]|uniref:F-box domain-containing protein n=1 Tax=Mycena citricolor TaxID=2018698 RepID=A0AAD2H5P7_9AGAR|nr:unnamed protein product [Mycena citricolor]